MNNSISTKEWNKPVLMILDINKNTENNIQGGGDDGVFGS